jgi:hypothetical protein
MSNGLLQLIAAIALSWCGLVEPKSSPRDGLNKSADIEFMQ